jgi:hypothetical protein
MSEHALKVSWGPQPNPWVPLTQTPQLLPAVYVHWKKVSKSFQFVEIIFFKYFKCIDLVNYNCTIVQYLFDLLETSDVSV